MGLIALCTPLHLRAKGLQTSFPGPPRCEQRIGRCRAFLERVRARNFVLRARLVQFDTEDAVESPRGAILIGFTDGKITI